MTEEYPPYNFHNYEGELVGVSVDLLEAIMKRMHIDFDKNSILVVPWARAYRHTLNTPNAAVFTMTKSQHRSGLFQFSEAIMPSNISIITLRNTLKLNKVADLNPLNVGVVRNDIGEQLLKKHGLKNESTVKLPTSLELIRMLLLNRIDVVAIDEAIANFEFNRLGVKPEEYTTHFTIEKLTTHYAFNAAIDKNFIADFSAAFEQLKADGTFEQIRAKY
ncbi:hypothetical protein MACH26_27690 [Planctobacterium marinum]|uniref:Solute-binding protein family 3/N-terminal domain-containing protein n=2 Tax=Planctobacterium marinum TaxID=1631968 RepID=A0AA48KR76_9ALTE|nr:hypothetical protein MACH26_27690 [Planctobacterium marinum]